MPRSSASSNSRRGGSAWRCDLNDRIKLWIVFRRILYMVIGALDEYLGYSPKEK